MIDSYSNHWSEYWTNGWLTSLPQDFNNNYDGVVADFWNDIFCQFNSDDTMLDICTGNGGIAILASESAMRKGVDVEIHAIDAANIDKELILKTHSQKKQYIANINYISNTLIENISFQDEYFDYITSQFGFEYCNWNEGAKELSRILKKNGLLVIMSHSPSSTIIDYMQKEEAQYQTIIDSQLDKVFEEFYSNTFSYHTFRKKLEKVLSSFDKALQNNNQHILVNYSQMILDVLSVSKEQILRMENHISSFRKRMNLAHLRTKDLLRVNLAIKKNNHWNNVFEKNNFRCIKSQSLHINSSMKFGDYYIFEKV